MNGMSALVEFCAANVGSYTKVVMEALENDPTVTADVVEYGCLGRCGECYMMPFALVNGDYVEADSPEELLQKIKEKLKQDEEAWAE